MVGTMIPMVYGEHARIGILPRLLVVHTLASTAGGLSTGLCLGYVSTLVAPRAHFPLFFFGLIVGSIAIIGALKEAALMDFHLPESRWQVPHEWAANKSHMAAAALYGFCLGVGLLTRMSSCLFPVLVWIVLQGHPATSIIIMVIFGVCRTVPMWMIYLTSPSQDTEYSRLCTHSLGQWQPAARLLSAFSLTFAGSLFLAAWSPYRIG